MKKLLHALMLALSLATPTFAADLHEGHTMGQQTTMASGAGVVKAIDTKASTITIAHEPIPSLKWPAMTMPFKLAKPELAKGLKIGQQVRFELAAEGMAGVITAIQAK